MNKKEIIGIIIVILGLFIVVFLFNSNSKNNLKDPVSNCPNDKIDSSYKDPQCITNLAVSLKNETFCHIYIRPSGGSAGVGPALDCIIRAYISIGNISNCDKLRYGVDRDYCKEVILNNS